MIKLDKAKTTLKEHGLDLANYIYSYYPLLSEKPCSVDLKSLPARRINRYLNNHANRIGENRLHGILAFTDSFRKKDGGKATGGRIHVLVGISGLIADCFFDPEVLPEPTDYEDKSNYFLKLIESVSEEERPYTGNIHGHIFRCSTKAVTPKDLTGFVQKEHGYQNVLQQISLYEPWAFIPRTGGNYWLPANAEMMKYLFSIQTTAN